MPASTSGSATGSCGRGLSEKGCAVGEGQGLLILELVDASSTYDDMQALACRVRSLRTREYRQPRKPYEPR